MPYYYIENVYKDHGRTGHVVEAKSIKRAMQIMKKQEICAPQKTETDVLRRLLVFELDFNNLHDLMLYGDRKAGVGGRIIKEGDK